jgi:hypothetical protein
MNEYKHELGGNFKCQEPVHAQELRRCIFHDENYLKGDNYGKHREEVARRFEKKNQNLL